MGVCPLELRNPLETIPEQSRDISVEFDLLFMYILFPKGCYNKVKSFSLINSPFFLAGHRKADFIHSS